MVSTGQSPTEGSPVMDPSSARGSATSAAALGGQAWLTAILRPAGLLDEVALRGVGATLGHLTAASNMVIVDLTAAEVRDPGALAAALRDPAAEFERASACLLVLGASAQVTAELNRADVRVVTLGDDVLPLMATAG